MAVEYGINLISIIGQNRFFDVFTLLNISV